MYLATTINVIDEIQTSLPLTTYQNFQKGVKLKGKNKFQFLIAIEGNSLVGRSYGDSWNYQFKIEKIGGRYRIDFPVNNQTFAEAEKHLLRKLKTALTGIRNKLKAPKSKRKGGRQLNGYYIRSDRPNSNTPEYFKRCKASGEYPVDFLDFAKAQRFIVQGYGSCKV